MLSLHPKKTPTYTPAVFPDGFVEEYARLRILLAELTIKLHELGPQGAKFAREINSQIKLIEEMKHAYQQTSHSDRRDPDPVFAF